jgi:hypothetical protein
MALTVLPGDTIRITIEWKNAGAESRAFALLSTLREPNNVTTVKLPWKLEEADPQILERTEWIYTIPANATMGPYDLIGYIAKSIEGEILTSRILEDEIVIGGVSPKVSPLAALLTIAGGLALAAI